MNSRKCEDLKLKRALRGMLRVQPSFRSNHLISKGGFTKCNENVKWITDGQRLNLIGSKKNTSRRPAEATGENENAFDRVQRADMADALFHPASPLMARCQRTNRWEAANRLTPSKVALQELQFHLVHRCHRCHYMIDI